MASLQSMSSFGSHGSKYGVGKSRTNPAVKPILKKWSQSEKEKRSPDPVRGWEEQDDGYRSAQAWGRSSSLSISDQMVAAPNAATIVEGVMPGTGGIGLGVLGNTTTVRRYNHARSISGTSYASGTTSNSSNCISAPRQSGATFVHPFQQTPRTSTPPLLSYANSLASIADTRDYSPSTITEDGDITSNDCGNCIATGETQPGQHHVNYLNTGVYAQNTNFVNNSNLLSQPISIPAISQLQTQRTSATDLSDIKPAKPQTQPNLRLNTSRTSSIPTHASLLANVSSRSDLYLNHIVDSPTSSEIGPTTLASPSSPKAAMSPLLRTSLDSGFRLRAKSDVDTTTRAEQLRMARQKFERKERAKDEKYEREEMKRRERADKKLAHEKEKLLAAQRKELQAARAREDVAELEEALQRGKHNRKVSTTSSGRPSLSIPRPSISVYRPSMSRKNTANTVNQLSEHETFMSSSYDNTDARSLPTYGDTVHPTRVTSPTRKSRAKRKTQGAWTAFILWLRTKLLRMGHH